MTPLIMTGRLTSHTDTLRGGDLLQCDFCIHFTDGRIFIGVAVRTTPLFSGPNESMSCEIIQGGVMISYRWSVLAFVAMQLTEYADTWQCENLQ